MSKFHRQPRRTLAGLVLVVVALVAALMTSTAGQASNTSTTQTSNTPAGTTSLSTNAGAPGQTLGQTLARAAGRGAKPTIVFVHGAWADASGWAAQLRALRARGYHAMALANPLRGLTADAAYIRSILDTIPGPVVLVGHSYGGAVISSAAAGAPNVRALVYVAAFMPDKNEPVGLLTELNPGSLVTDAALSARPYPIADGTTGTDLYLRPGIFRKAFAGDLPPRTTRLMWATQRPLAAAAFGEPATAAAWRTIRSWYVLATRDRTIPPKTQAYMAHRAGAKITRVRASHVAMQSRPAGTTKVILAAIRAVR